MPNLRGCRTLWTVSNLRGCLQRRHNFRQNTKQSKLSRYTISRPELTIAEPCSNPSNSNRVIVIWCTCAFETALLLNSKHQIHTTNRPHPPSTPFDFEPQTPNTSLDTAGLPDTWLRQSYNTTSHTYITQKLKKRNNRNIIGRGPWDCMNHFTCKWNWQVSTRREE